MSQRETKQPGSLQQWKGVNQRLQPTLVPDGFFSDARGVFFGFGENAERMPGKSLAGILPKAVLGIFVFNAKALIQTLDALWVTDVTDLTNLALTFNPKSPLAPSFNAVTDSSFNVILPALPTYALSLTLQRSADGISWTTTNTGQTAGAIISFVGETPSTTVYFRVLGVNAVGATAGPSATVTTTAALALTYVSDGDANGLFYKIGQIIGSGVWTDPSGAGGITITLNGTGTFGTNGTKLVDRMASDAFMNPSADNGWTVDLGANRAVAVNYVSFRQRTTGVYDVGADLAISGSNDNVTFTPILAKNAADVPDASDAWGSWPVSPASAAYRYIKYRQPASGSYFTCGEIELYGVFYYVP